MRFAPPEQAKSTAVFLVRNENRGTTLGCGIRLAGSSQERRTGLLNHTELRSGAGLWINPCEAIHTFGMKFPIDVAFLDAQLRVIKTCHSVAPRRISTCLRAVSVLELPAGTLGDSQTELGDSLNFHREYLVSENIPAHVPLNALNT